MREGKSLKWYKNGQLKSDCNYANGKYDGEIITYWENGKIKRKDFCKEDKLQNGTCYDSLGNEIKHFNLEVMPEYKGGDRQLINDISNNLNYPINSRDSFIQGRVLVRFAVNEQGNLSNIEIVEGINPELNMEAITYSNTLAQIPPPNERLPISDFREKPKTKWVFEIKSPIFSSPIVSEDLVYIGGLDSIFYAIEISSGHEKWRFRTKGEIRSASLIYGARVFLNGGDGSLYALDKKSGEIIWKFDAKCERKYDFADYFHSTPVINDRVLYFGSGDSNFYAIDSDTGHVIWSFKTGNIIHTTEYLSFFTHRYPNISGNETGY